MRALRDGIGHHAVNSHGGETERECGKGHQQRQIEARLNDGIREQLVHCADFVDGHVLVDREDLLADGVRYAGWFKGRAYGKIHTSEEGALREREIGLFASFHIRPIVFYVADYSDNGTPLRHQGFGIGNGINGDAFANGILVWPEPAHKISVHNRYERRISRVRISQEPSALQRNLKGLEISWRSRAIIRFDVGQIVQWSVSREVRDGSMLHERAPGRIRFAERQLRN